MTNVASPSDTHQAALAIGARIDRIPRLTRSHRGLVAMLAALFIFDVIDLAAYSLVIPAIRAEWGLSLEVVGVLTSMVFIGMFFGGIFGGRLAERFGRKTIMLIAVTTFSIGSFASALSPNFGTLAASRILTGLGIAATSALLYVMINELFPKPFRGRMMATVITIGTLGGPLIVAFALNVVPLGLWHLVFVVGSLGVIPVAIALKVLPESPRWLASRGRFDEADRTVSKWEKQYESSYPGVTLPEPVIEEVRTPARSSFGSLFKPTFLPRTLIATFLFFLMLGIQAGIGQWLPTILVERGFPQEDALGITFILTFSGIAGGLIGLFVIDRFERKWLIVTCGLIMIVGFAAMGYVNSVPVIIAAGILQGLTMAVVASATPTYATEIFPTEIRATGMGFANGFSRTSGFANSLIIGVIFATFSTGGVFAWIIALAALLVLVAALGPQVGVVAARRARLAAKAQESMR